ncbi:MAG TPA: lyase family protein [Candidatus Paceibacterota bacterium]
MESNLALPGNPRYQPKSLQPYFGYDALMRPVGEVELASLEVLAEVGVIPASDIAILTPDIRKAVLDIRTTRVDEVERKVTRHDIRAWVQIAKEIVGPTLGRWVHVVLTSYDPIETARSLQYCRAHDEVVKPSIVEVSSIFVEHIRRSANTLQIGRTHGQHALPITVGFWLATLLSRVLTNFGIMDTFKRNLVGKISGAVGAHNAQVGLGIAELCEKAPPDQGAPYGNNSFEHRVLRKLGLQPAPISTQILPPEYLAYYLNAAVMLTGSFGQLGRDCRQLQRNEIAEVVEEFQVGQVGSSTMANKRNPITWENMEGMYLRTMAEYVKVMVTLISEHQRDLVGSCVARDFPIIIVNLVQQLETLLRRNDKGIPFLTRIKVNDVACRENFERGKRVILAEPLYIALQMAGYRGDAHELINRKAVPLAEQDRIPLIVAVEALAGTDSELSDALGLIPKEVYELFSEPEKYTGNAAQCAHRIADWGEQRVKELSC